MTKGTWGTGWRAHLTGREAVELMDAFRRRDEHKAKAAEASREIATIRNTCAARKRRAL